MKTYKNTQLSRPPLRKSNYKRGIGIFSNQEATEKALSELRKAGFDKSQVSVFTQDTNYNAYKSEIAHKTNPKMQKNQAEAGAAIGAVSGGALGGLLGLLIGISAFAIPGVGPLVFAGAEGAAIATTLGGAGIGAAAGGLIGALIKLGIPKEHAKFYNKRLSKGDYLIVVSGTEATIREAENILIDYGIKEWGVYNAPDLAQGNIPVQNSTSHSPVVVVDKRNSAYR